MQALIRFDLADRRLYFDIEQGVAVLEKGTPESPDYAADVLELLLGLVLKGELYAWDGDTHALLGRKDPNIPVNIDARATTENLNAEIRRLRAEAQRRRETSSERTAVVNGSMPDFNIRPPPHIDIVQTYGLTPLLNGLDLSLTADGDLATTVDFDLKMGDDQQNGLHRLVVRWRFNEPALRGNFAAVIESFEREKALNGELNDVATKILQADAVERYHEIQDEIGVLSFGRDAAAGTIMVVLANLLHRLRVDLGLHPLKFVASTPAEWFTSPPTFAGYSLGAVLDAAAANFRHHDEWARTEPPNEQQLRSITVMGAVLGKTIASDGSKHPFRGNDCPEILLAVSDGKFETLNENLFAFAKALAKV